MKETLKHQIRQILRKYMFEHELNQSKLAQILGVHKSVVSQIINENLNLSLDRVEEYFDKLGLELEIKVKE